MPQFNASSMYSPNEEYRIQKEGGKYRLYYLKPTNIVDMGWGARAAGGAVDDLGLFDAAGIYQKTGNSVGNIYSLLPGGVEAYKAAATPDTGTIQQQLTQTFSGFDPNNTTGWKEKLPDLTTKAQQLYSQDPTQKDKIYGTVWNQFRYDPTNLSAIGKIQSENAIKTGSGTINPPPGSTSSGNPLGYSQSQPNIYQAEYDRIKTQYPNDPNTALQVFKAANPNAPADFLQQISSTESSQQVVTPQEQNLSQLPSNITSSPQWSQLSADQQALIKLYYSSTQVGTAEQKAKIDLALNEAIKIADPWLKEQINIVKDELSRSTGVIQGDYQSKSSDLENRVKSIQEDLVYNKENLTLDQQTELASQLRKYKGDLFNLQQSAAESGLAFSSPRSTAESNLNASNQDIVQSTRQKYGRALREQDVTAQRNLLTLQQSAADLERKRQESLTTLEREAEKQLGSNITPDVTGTSKLGGLSGSIPGQQAQYVTNMAGTLLNNPLNQLLK